MSENKTFRLFHKKEKKREQEKGHREPIVVRMFKDNSGIRESLNVEHIDSDEREQGKVTESSEFESKSWGTESGESRKKARFTPSSKYLTIMIYGLMFIAFASIIITMVLKISTITGFIAGVLKVLAPFIGAGMLAFIMNPIVNGIEGGLLQKVLKINKPKLRLAISIIIAYVIVFGLIVFGLVKLGPQLGESIKELAGRSSEIYDSIMKYTDSLAEKLPEFDVKGTVDKLVAMAPDLISKLTDSSTDIIPQIFNTSVAIIRGVINGLLAIAISIYMICDKRRIAKAATKIVYAILPEKKAKGFSETSKDCLQIFGGFIIGKAIDSLIIGIICFVIVTILRLPYTVLISVIVGITNLIPFFGPFIGAIPGIIIYLCLNPIYALIFAIVILAIQQFDGWVLGPMILGDSTGIRPIWVIFGITFFGAYFGVLGMFLGVPLTAVILYLIEKALNRSLNKKNIEIT